MRRVSVEVMGSKVNLKKVIVITTSKYATSKTLGMTKQFKADLVSEVTKKRKKITLLKNMGKQSRKNANLFVSKVVTTAMEKDSYCCIYTRCLTLINAFIDAGKSGKHKAFLNRELLFIRSEVTRGKSEFYLIPEISDRKALLTIRECLLDPRGL